MKSVFVAALLSAGCSFIFVDKPPSNHRQLNAFDCTASNVAPVLDGIWGVLNLVGAAIASGTSDADWHSSYDKNGAMVVGVAWALLSGLSMGYGLNRTSECRDAKEDLFARLNGIPPPHAQQGGRSVPSAALPQSSVVRSPSSPALPPAVSAPVAGGCEKDTDCKGERICEQRQCVSPK